MSHTFRVAPTVFGIDLEMHDREVLTAYIIAGEIPTVIEPGHAAGAGILRAGLREIGIDPTAVEHAVVSHVHLDHSGGAAALATAADDLSVWIHPSTADHLIDPDDLIESSHRAMGDYFEGVGGPDSLPREYLAEATDGTVIDLGDRTLELLHTPGHAPDHIAVWLPEADLLFANEAIGSHYVRTDTWVPPATVPQFDPDSVRKTIDRLESLDPDVIAFSHFGVHFDPTTVFDRARERLATFNRRVPELYEAHNGDLAATERAVGEELLEMDDYDNGVAAMQRRVQTRGFLMHHDLL